MTPTCELLAVPGTLCAPAVFDRLDAALADQVALRPVSWLTEPGPWDIPSTAARIAERLTGPTAVLGHSTGGAIAMQLAVTHPELVSALLLSDTGAHTRGHGDVDAILHAIATRWGRALHAQVLDRSFLDPPEAAVRERLLDWAGTVEQQAAYDVLRSQRDLDLSDRLADIAVPVIVVHGRHDRARSVGQAEELTRAIAGAELVLLETGHTPVYEAPDAVATQVRRLLSRIR